MTARPRAGFDAASGTFIADDGTAFGPALTRSAFLASPAGRTAESLVANGQRASWRLLTFIAGRPFALGLYFDGEPLTMVIAALSDAAFGSTWADWSKEHEGARKAAHEDWLAAFDPTIGSGRDYPWGFVSSVYDERSGGSEIVVRYGARLPERIPPSPIRFDPPDAAG